MDEWKKDRINSAVKGENPTVLVKMKSGFAVIGDPQFLPGYCILLGFPQVNCLNDLSIEQRKEYLIDMSLIGDAITAVCKPLRINYDILGNTDTYLHAHIFPRYDWEEERNKMPVWKYPRECWSMEKYQYNDVKFGELKNNLKLKLQELMEINY